MTKSLTPEREVQLSGPSSNLSIVLDGRRYQLVPLDEPPATPTNAVVSQCLTAREQQIASLVAAGWGNKEIALRLSISVWTVSTHLRRIFAKLGVKTRAAMVSRCLEVLPLNR